MPSPSDLQETGRIIREIRKQMGRTLADLAEQCGCTVSFLSKLENGRTAPSLNTLHRIAASLGVNIGTLAPQENKTARRIVRAQGRPLLGEPFIRSGDGIHLEMISGQCDGELFQVNLHHVNAGGRSDGQIVHAGDEFIYILQGEIDLLLGDEVIRLGEGDAAFFSSTEPHGYANPTDQDATVLWLNSPPTY
jgi:transcriptional regulator with XRE-family HTH domain